MLVHFSCEPEVLLPKRGPALHVVIHQLVEKQVVHDNQLATTKARRSSRVPGLTNPSRSTVRRLLPYAPPRTRRHWAVVQNIWTRITAGLRLRRLGLDISFAGGVQIEIPGEWPTVEPSVHDLAAGLLKQWALGGEALRQWASVVLALANVNLASLEVDPEGEELLEGLWDAASGQGLSESSLSVVRRLAK